MNAQLTAAIANLRDKGEALGLALTLEQSLEDDRAAVKADAIRRVMKRDGTATTVAEKVVETDADYFIHREKQRASIVARFKADAEYWAAKCEATQASLITPTVIELEAQVEQWSASIDAANRAVEEATRVNAELFRAAGELKHKLDERDDTIKLLNDRAAQEDATINLLNERGADLQRANADLVEANRELADQVAELTAFKREVESDLKESEGLLPVEGA